MVLIAIFLVSLFLYGLASGRLERTVLTAPILFTIAGTAIVLLVPPLRTSKVKMELLLYLAETGLVLLLFSDACRTDLKLLKSIRTLPARLLSIGLLLTILLGALLAKVVFPQLNIWEAGILAAILAPTDAGLGQIIVTSPRVPLKIRQALNVEAGLNDGLAVPFLLFFIALAGDSSSARESGLSQFIAEQLGLGTMIGIAIGLTGGFLLRIAHDRQWISESFEQLTVVVLPLLCMLVSELLSASMFIAAFVAGLAVQIRFKQVEEHALEFDEEWGQLLNLSVFFLFGVLVARLWDLFDLRCFIYAVLSLTVVRMLPVAVALIGSRLHWSTIIFSGWFGPRGLASIVLGLVYLEQNAQHPGETIIRTAVMATVLLSVFVHGFTSRPGINWYAAKIEDLEPETVEKDSDQRQPSTA